MRSVLASVVLSVASLCLHAGAPSALGHDDATSASAPSIIVTGVATRSVAADKAVIQLGVSTEGKTAQEAASRNATALTAVLAALEKAGVDRQEISTGYFSVSPRYEYRDQPQGGPPRLVGYNVDNMVTVTTLKLDSSAKIIDQALAAGANRVDSVSFVLSDPRSHESDALAEAVLKARSDAARTAEAAGVKLVGVRRIVVGDSAGQPRPFFAKDAFAGRVEAAAAPTQLLPGKIEVRASVTIEFDVSP